MFDMFEMGTVNSAHDIVEIFMFCWEHYFRVDGANQVRYLSAMPASTETTQIKVGHYSTIRSKPIFDVF